MIYLFIWTWPAILGQAMIVCMNPLSWVPCYNEEQDNVANET